MCIPANKMQRMDTEDWAIPYLRDVMRRLEIEHPSQLAEKAGVYSTTLTRPMNNPDHPYKISRTTLEKVKKATGIPFPHEAGSDVVTSSKPDDVMVPVYDIAASAGPGTYVDYEVQVAQMSLPRDYIKHLTSTPPDQLAIISVKGDSMTPTLNDGDIVLVDGAKTSGSFDGLFVINFDGTLHIKRLARGSRPGTVRILSDNSAYYPPVDALIDDLHIVGRVRWAAGPV